MKSLEKRAAFEILMSLNQTCVCNFLQRLYVHYLAVCLTWLFKTCLNMSPWKRLGKQKLLFIFHLECKISWLWVNSNECYFCTAVDYQSDPDGRLFEQICLCAVIFPDREWMYLTAVYSTVSTPMYMQIAKHIFWSALRDVRIDLCMSVWRVRRVYLRLIAPFSSAPSPCCAGERLHSRRDLRVSRLERPHALCHIKADSPSAVWPAMLPVLPLRARPAFNSTCPVLQPSTPKG